MPVPIDLVLRTLEGGWEGYCKRKIINEKVTVPHRGK